MTFQCLDLEQSGAVSTITLNRPEFYNAMNAALLRELVDAVEHCRQDRSVRAVIITGAGAAFCAGGDMRAAREHIAAGGNPQHFFRDLTKHLHRMVSDLRLLDKPVIAAVNGPAAGAGFSLALACDLRLAADSARFNQAYTAMGLTPDGGLSILLPLIVGIGKTSEMLLLNTPLDAQAALALGVVTQVVPRDELLPLAREMATRLAAGPTTAFAVAKSGMNAAIMPHLEVVLERERQNLMAVGATADFPEALNAFFAKRKPQFQGK